MKFLTALISVTVALVHSGVVVQAIAQEADGCFMRDGSGRVMDLTRLCGGISPTKPRTFTTKIKRRYGGTPIIEVTFNGNQKFEMLLDTGASQTTITPQMANAIKVIPTGVELAQIANGDIIEFPMGRVASVEVGGAVSNNFTVSIGAVPLLGQNFFGGYDVTIKRDVVIFSAQ